MELTLERVVLEDLPDSSLGGEMGCIQRVLQMYKKCVIGRPGRLLSGMSTIRGIRRVGAGVQVS
mgnify:CR=1 FL=1